MSWVSQFDDFARAMYRDSGLKTRVIFWTFLLLVLPASLFSASGLPLKITSIAVAILIVPVQVGVFTFWRRKRSSANVQAEMHAEMMEEFKRARKVVAQWQ